jgi:TP901 family phage tail tape measure protein
MSRFSIEALFKGNDQVSAVVGKIQTKVNAATSGMRSGLHSLGEANEKIGESFEAVAHKALAAGAAIGAVVGAGLAHVVHTGAEFEQSITNVGAVMGKTRSQIAELEKSALSLGVTTQFSASEVSEAMEFMARKGFDSEEILEGIPGVLNAIAASGEGMAEVATVVGSSIRGFGLEAKQAGYVANVLAFTAEKTGAKITDMGTALAIAAPTAKALNVSIEDTAAAVGLLQKTGIDSSTAGSAVATMLAKISHPAAEVAAKMTAMGVKFKDAKGDMLPFRDVLGQFVKAGAKAGGTMDKMSFFADLVGLRGDKAALGLERMTKSGEFDKLLDSLKNTGNYAEKVAQIRLDTTMGSWKLLLSTVEVLEVKLFQLKGGALRGVIDSMNAWLQANQELIVTKVSDFIKGIADNMPKIVTWGTRILKIVAVFLAFSTAVKAANTAISVVDFVTKNPYVALALAIVAAIALIIAYWPEISAFFGRLWESIKSGAAAVGAWFSRLWSGVSAAFMSVWNPVAAFFDAFWGGVKATVRGVIDFIVGLWTLELYAIVTVMRGVVNLFRPMWEPVLAYFTWLWGMVKAAFSMAWDGIVMIASVYLEDLKAVWAPISEFYSALWQGVKAVFTFLWDGLIRTAKDYYGTFLSIWKPLASFFSGLWDGVSSAFMSAMGWILNKVEGIVAGIERAVNFVQGVGHGVTDSALGGGDGGEGPQVVSPGERTAGSMSEFYTHNTGEITVRAEPGSSASVSKPPSGGFGLNLAPSGGF